MAQLAGIDETKYPSFEIRKNGGRSVGSSFRFPGSISKRSSSIGSARANNDDEYELQWAAIERLPTFQRLRTSMFDPFTNGSSGEGEKEKKVIDVTKLGPLERRLLIEKLIKHIEKDNLRLLWKQHLSYWRSPSYNLVRMIFMIISSVAFAILFWRLCSLI